jgi:hypothetical protein
MGVKAMENNFWSDSGVDVDDVAVSQLGTATVSPSSVSITD